MAQSLAVRVVHRHLALRVASRYIGAMRGSPKQQAKKRYELAKTMLQRSEHPIRAWLLVIDTFPGWKKKMVDDPKGDRYEVVYNVTAPNGKSMLLYPKSFSIEHAAEVDQWMRKETDVLEQLGKEVGTFEEAARAPAAAPPKPSPAKLGIPIAEVDFTDPKRVFWLIDFGLRDERGRAVGCMARFYAPGEYGSNPTWLLSMQATRNGERFGSSHGTVKGDAREAVETTARKMMMTSFKRYTQLYGGK